MTEVYRNAIKSMIVLFHDLQVPLTHKKYNRIRVIGVTDLGFTVVPEIRTVNQLNYPAFYYEDFRKYYNAPSFNDLKEDQKGCWEPVQFAERVVELAEIYDKVVEAAELGNCVDFLRISNDYVCKEKELVELYPTELDMFRQTDPMPIADIHNAFYDEWPELYENLVSDCPEREVFIKPSKDANAEDIVKAFNRYCQVYEFYEALHSYPDLADCVKHLVSLKDLREMQKIIDKYGQKIEEEYNHSKTTISELYARRKSDLASSAKQSKKKSILNKIDEMDGYAFERWCGELLKALGYKDVIVTKGSGDQGVDLTAVKHRVKYAFQCKKRTVEVTNRAVQEIKAGMIHYRANVGIVITNRTFTPSAIELANENHIVLWDRSMLMALAEEAKLE